MATPPQASSRRAPKRWAMAPMAGSDTTLAAKGRGHQHDISGVRELERPEHVGIEVGADDLRRGLHRQQIDQHPPLAADVNPPDELAQRHAAMIVVPAAPARSGWQ